MAEASVPYAAGLLRAGGVAHVGAYASPYALNQAYRTYGAGVGVYGAGAGVYGAGAAILPAAATYTAAAPAVVAPAAVAPAVVTKTAGAVVAPAPAVTSSQYRAGDEFGNTAFGYTNPISSRMEQGNADGVVTGTYSYVDEAGSHTRSYIADAYGFRLTGDSNVHAHKKRSAGYAPAYGYAAPAYAPYQATRDAELLTIKLNPGHATFYRVY